MMSGVFLLVVNTITLSGSNTKMLARQARYLNPIMIFTFPNSPCTGANTGLTGACYKADECLARDGSLSDGSCARGFGVCCVVRMSGCGGDVRSNSTHIQNTNYPSDFTSATTCSYNLVKIDKEICFFRLDFIHFVLEEPVSSSNWDCSADKIVFTTPYSRPPPTICGYNTGQHMFLDASYGLAETNPTMVITTTGTTTSRYWRIRVDQVYCGEVFSPPHGCTQFFMAESGRIRSYNFGVNDNYHHLAEQDYAVCFRRARGFCRISYSATEEGESFWTSRNPTATTYSSAGESSCIADFLIIPRGTNGGVGAQCTSPAAPPTAQSQVDLGRFCGRRLSCASSSLVNSIIYSDLLPFHFHVEFNGAEPTTGIGNRGFSLDFRQILC